jgi:hypothetical protein
MNGWRIRAGQLSADVQWRCVAWEPDDPQHFVGPVRRVAGPQRVSEDEPGCGLLDIEDVWKAGGIVVRSSVRHPSWLVALVNVSRTATSRNYRRIRRQALRNR